MGLLMLFELNIDNEKFSFEINGDFSYGEDKVLFDENGLLEKVSWKRDGYSLINLFDKDEIKTLKKNVLKILDNIFSEIDLDRIPDLESYHKVVDTSEKHQSVISKTRFLKSIDFQIDLEDLSKRISTHLKKNVGIKNPLLEEEIIILRISRPNSLDINPLHRDGYLEIWENTINVWIPLAGCNSRSSLPIIPGSHLWNEKYVLRTPPKNAKIGGNTYHVPGIIGGPTKLEAIRPNPESGQALIFTPFIIHGAAINQNDDETRMALEFRLCAPKPQKKDPIII
jgi:hypothetical protein